MKRLLRLAVVLLIGCVLGFVFHDPIDTKLTEKFGKENVESGKELVEKGVEKGKELTEKGIDKGKEFIQEKDSAKTE